MLIAQQEAQERCWQLAAACQPHLTKRGQQEGWSAAKQVGDVGFRRKSALDLVDQATRIEMIGSHLKLFGEKWARRHKQHLDWLDSIGVSREEAIRRHEAWHARVMADPFWRENREELN